MKCGVCHAPLTVRGYSTKRGRRSPLYQPCPRINDPAHHPAAARRYVEGATVVKRAERKAER